MGLTDRSSGIWFCIAKKRIELRDLFGDTPRLNAETTTSALLLGLLSVLVAPLVNGSPYGNRKHAGVALRTEFLASGVVTWALRI